MNRGRYDVRRRDHYDYSRARYCRRDYHVPSGGLAAPESGPYADVIVLEPRGLTLIHYNGAKLFRKDVQVPHQQNQSSCILGLPVGLMRR